jgi:CPA1 family monovalent cation:H+ antiporter
MTLIDILAVLLTLSALFGSLNENYLRLPHTVGLVAIALVASLAVILAQFAFPELGIGERARAVLEPVNFHTVLLDGFLSALLFAGALHVDLASVAKRRAAIFAMAIVGTLLSTVIVGGVLWGSAHLLGFQLPLIWAALFGALISPTDPIAVIAIMKRVHVPELLRVEMEGESLLNDGVGVVLFTVLLGLVEESGSPSIAGMAVLGEAARLFAQEALGGAALGLVTGGIAFVLMRPLDEYVIEVMVTLALVAGTYALAQHLHVSGPIAVVVAGVLVGNHGARFAMSERTRSRLFPFWELVDEILNSLLFLLIGLEILVIGRAFANFALAATAIPIVLLARLVSVAIPIGLLSLAGLANRKAIPILTWGGLRGGISVALALSLPASEYKNALLTATYAVVVFSIVVQAVTIERLVRSLLGGPATMNPRT